MNKEGKKRKQESGQESIGARNKNRNMSLLCIPSAICVRTNKWASSSPHGGNCPSASLDPSLSIPPLAPIPS